MRHREEGGHGEGGGTEMVGREIEVRIIDFCGKY